MVFLATIALGVFLLFQASKLIGTVVERKILGTAVDASIEIKPEARALPAGRLGYDTSILVSPLFAPGEGKASSAGSSTGGNANPKGETLLDSPLLRKYELNGVILLHGGASIAIIRKAGERQGQIYRKGDKIDNLDVQKIERDKVTLFDGVNRIVLPMYYRFLAKAEAPGQGQAAQQEKRPEAVDRYSASTQVKKVLSRSDVETRVFQKVNEILTQIAVSPNMADGKMDGLKLLRVPANNIVYELGARSGDIIRRVNGHEVNQVDQMYKLWENIKDDSQISVDLERNSQVYTYSFDIRE
jgi:general secretion pathway protein C